MKSKIFAVGFAVMFVLMASFTAFGADTGNEVYDFDEGEYPNIFVPFNQSVESWNDFTGLELEEGDWLNITYTDLIGDAVSNHYYVFDEDEYIDITWNVSVWGNVTGYALFTELYNKCRDFSR